MTDQQQEARLRLSMPDEWTLEHWRRFNGGRQEFINKARAANEFADNLTANFFGVKALIDSSYVRLEGDRRPYRKPRRWSRQRRRRFLFVGLLDREVADKIEAASTRQRLLEAIVLHHAKPVSEEQPDGYEAPSELVLAWHLGEYHLLRNGGLLDQPALHFKVSYARVCMERAQGHQCEGISRLPA